MVSARSTTERLRNAEAARNKPMGAEHTRAGLAIVRFVTRPNDSSLVGGGPHCEASVGAIRYSTTRQLNRLRVTGPHLQGSSMRDVGNRFQPFDPSSIRVSKSQGMTQQSSRGVLIYLLRQSMIRVYA